MQRRKGDKVDLAVFIVLALMAVVMLQGTRYATTHAITALPWEAPLFDISVTIPDEYREVSSGHQLLTSIKLVNLGNQGRVDVNLDYLIEDSNHKIILKQAETAAVETQTSFVRYFSLPLNMEPGTYTLSATLSYLDGQRIAVAQNWFTIVPQKTAQRELPSDVQYLKSTVAVLFALILVLFIIVFQMKAATKKLLVAGSARYRKKT